jgi:hypothetical protein
VADTFVTWFPRFTNVLLQLVAKEGVLDWPDEWIDTEAAGQCRHTHDTYLRFVLEAT